jgi:hypothetical protein
MEGLNFGGRKVDNNHKKTVSERLTVGFIV